MSTTGSQKTLGSSKDKQNLNMIIVHCSDCDV